MSKPRGVVVRWFPQFHRQTGAYPEREDMMDDAQTARWHRLGKLTRRELISLKARFEYETGIRTVWSAAGPFHTWRHHDMVSYFMWGGAEKWEWESGPAATPQQPAGPATAPDITRQEERGTSGIVTEGTD